MNKKAVIRRKWSFEKGRNSSAVIIAALMVFAVLAVLFGFFSYEYRFPGNKEQKGIMVRIDPKLNAKLFELIDRRDPSRIFDIAGDDFSGLYKSREYDNITLEYELPEIGTIPQIPVAGEAAINIAPIPVSAGFSPILPVDNSRAAKRLATRIIASDGKEIVIPAQARLKGRNGTSGTVKISGSKFLRQAETLVSCGDRRVDRQTEAILKNSDLVPGVYQIYYYDGAARK